MPAMCADCPFGNTKKQCHMRDSLRTGRFNEIAQSVWAGAYFPCHKTTDFGDDDELINLHKTKQCAGAIEFVARCAENRRRAEKRAGL